MCPQDAQTGPAHVAFLYRGEAEYVDGVMGFLEPGLREDEPVVVAVPDLRAGILMDQLSNRGLDVQFLDMQEIGRNPARIIPAVLGVLERHGGRTLHYVGEPVWPGRSQAEIQEATRHEALINLAWPGAAIRVLCPYDAAGLDPAVLQAAEATHPWLWHSGQAVPSSAYGGSAFPIGMDDPLSDPPDHASSIDFGLQDLSSLRALVSARAATAGVPTDRTDDLIIAVSEVASNAIKYAPTGGRLRVWECPGELICQLEDRGHLTDPLVGRHLPIPGPEGGIGLWMVNQLCDLVEVRTTAAGTTIRLHARTS